MEDKEITYKEAIEELREILQSLQGEMDEIEQIESKMKRARFLIRFCNQKIKDVHTSVEDIVREMEEETGDS